MLGMFLDTDATCYRMTHIYANKLSWLAWRRLRWDLTNLYKCLKGGCQEHVARLLSVVPRAGQEAMGSATGCWNC